MLDTMPTSSNYIVLSTSAAHGALCFHSNAALYRRDIEIGSRSEQNDAAVTRVRIPYALPIRTQPNAGTPFRRSSFYAARAFTPQGRTACGSSPVREEPARGFGELPPSSP